MRYRLAVLVSLVALVLLLLPGTAFGWANGPSGSDSFGTHDWVLQEAGRLAASQNAAWVRLSVALPHTDDPDSILHDTYYHVYDVWGNHYGNAPKKVALYYGRALAARKPGDLTTASRWVGIMAQYHADICCPLQTDQIDAGDDMHSDDESDVDDYPDAVGVDRAWVKYDGPTATGSVVSYTESTAAAPNKRQSALVCGFNNDGMSAAVVTITAKPTKGVANDLARFMVSPPARALAARGAER